MRPTHGLWLGGVLAIGLLTAMDAAPARAQSTQPDPQASPSEKPASAAAAKAGSGQMTPASADQTGTQQAAPSAKAANESTPGAVDADKKKTAN